jgi:hypothetical protein
MSSTFRRRPKIPVRRTLRDFQASSVFELCGKESEYPALAPPACGMYCNEVVLHVNPEPCPRIAHDRDEAP